MSLPLVEINGIAASAAQMLAAGAGYGHFTSLQVRDGAVAGLSLHFRRLADATQRLFGSTLDLAQLRVWLEQALRNANALDAASVRIVVHAARFDRERPEAATPVDVMIAVSAAIERKRAPIRVQLRTYERELPQVKHLATFGLLWQRREARLAGYDDALFETRAGLISEGSVWNIGFWDGARVIWPQAPMLDGISQQVLKLGLVRNGVASEVRELRREQLRDLSSAFACNANGVAVPIASIDGIGFDPAPELIDELLRCYESAEPEAV
ncbi:MULTISPECIES: aminotransferase class IV [Hydrocarboniphaga]|uniref:Aminodeoxychorismate lyase n=1 Tax=Hydrocarboniphaga effusa AP103 TaxID=1172194 RepID=I8I4B9_9GAMM|nr:MULTISPECIES: aminotransferase class IV [Hydrocarboniphaga]EIT71026.1 hypothetical protein WQQ_11630 [Hydrocarboniphaga effusa AP103]MDZ4079092.1 aminotransferase class IV [Hydrocarboniphaga sp.]